MPRSAAVVAPGRSAGAGASRRTTSARRSARHACSTLGGTSTTPAPRRPRARPAQAAIDRSAAPGSTTPRCSRARAASAAARWSGRPWTTATAASGVAGLDFAIARPSAGPGPPLSTRWPIRGAAPVEDRRRGPCRSSVVTAARVPGARPPALRRPPSVDRLRRRSSGFVADASHELRSPVAVVKPPARRCSTTRSSPRAAGDEGNARIVATVARALNGAGGRDARGSPDRAPARAPRAARRRRGQIRGPGVPRASSAWCRSIGVMRCARRGRPVVLRTSSAPRGAALALDGRSPVSRFLRSSAARALMVRRAVDRASRPGRLGLCDRRRRSPSPAPTVGAYSWPDHPVRHRHLPRACSRECLAFWLPALEHRAGRRRRSGGTVLYLKWLVALVGHLPLCLLNIRGARRCGDASNALEIFVLAPCAVIVGLGRASRSSPDGEQVWKPFTSAHDDRRSPRRPPGSWILTWNYLGSDALSTSDVRGRRCATAPQTVPAACWPPRCRRSPAIRFLSILAGLSGGDRTGRRGPPALLARSRDEDLAGSFVAVAGSTVGSASSNGINGAASCTTCVTDRNGRFVDGSLDDWYAQDEAREIWYLGDATTSTRTASRCAIGRAREGRRRRCPGAGAGGHAPRRAAPAAVASARSTT